MAIAFVVFIESVIVTKFRGGNFGFVKRMRRAISKRQALSNDYYNHMNYRFLETEYERSKKYIDELHQHIMNLQGTENDYLNKMLRLKDRFIIKIKALKL